MRYIISMFLTIVSLNLGTSQKIELVDADNLYRSLQFTQALQTLNNLINAYPDLAEAYMQRARVYGALGNDRAKDQDIAMANYLNPYSHLLYSSLDRAKLIAQKKYAYSTDVYEDEDNASFAKSPLKPELYLEMLENSDQYTQDSIILISIEQILNKDFDSAEQLLINLKGSSITDKIALDLLGVIQMKRGNYATAIEYFDQVVAQDPNFIIAYHNRSICYKELGYYQEANNDLSKAIELNGNLAHFYFTKALLNEQLNDTDAALENYEKAINENPEYEEALINYSVLLKKLGEYEYAIESIDQVIDLNPEKAENLFLRGNVNLIYGAYEDAIEDFDAYLKVNQNDPKSIFNKGMALILKGDTMEGCNQLRRSESLGLKKSIDFINVTCD